MLSYILIKILLPSSSRQCLHTHIQGAFWRTPKSFLFSRLSAQHLHLRSKMCFCFAINTTHLSGFEYRFECVHLMNISWTKNWKFNIFHWERLKPHTHTHMLIELHIWYQFIECKQWCRMNDNNHANIE